MRRRKMTQERADAYLWREAWLDKLDKKNKAAARKRKDMKTRKRAEANVPQLIFK